MKLTLDSLFYSNYIFIYVYKNGTLLYSFIKKFCKLGSIRHLTFFFFYLKLLGNSRPFTFSYINCYKRVSWNFHWDCVESIDQCRQNNLMILNILIHIQCAFLHSWRVFSAMFCGFMSTYQEHILYFLLLYCTGKNVQDKAK